MPRSKSRDSVPIASGSSTTPGPPPPKKSRRSRKSDVSDEAGPVKLSPPTLATHAYVIDLVLEYLNRIDPGAGDNMRDSGTVDQRLNELASLKTILHFIVQCTKPASKDEGAKLSVVTVVSMATRLSSALHHFGKGPEANGYSAPAGVKTLPAYVTSELRDEFELTTEIRRKFSCNAANLNALFAAIYSEKPVYHSLREMLQLHLLILISLNHITRPGEIMTTHHYRDNEHGILWRDVKFVVTAGAEDRADTEKVVQRCQVGVEMTITNLKGHKGDETVTKTKLFYPETDPKYDLVAIILALARLDDVLDKGFTVQEVLALDPAVVQDKFGGKLVLGVRPEKQQEPLLKKYDLEDDVYVISNEAAMPAERGRYLLRAAGKAAGFTKPLAFYDFRRTGANLINTPGVASPSEANLAMGHGVDATTSSKYYISRSSFVDTQALLAGRMQDRDRLKAGEGIPMLTTPLGVDPGTRATAVEADPDVKAARKFYLELREKLLSRYSSLRAAHGVSNDADVEAFDDAENELSYARDRARRRFDKNAIEQQQQASIAQELASTSTSLSPIPPILSGTHETDVDGKDDVGKDDVEGKDDELDAVELTPGARLADRAGQLTSITAAIDPELAGGLDDIPGSSATTGAQNDGDVGGRGAHHPLPQPLERAARSAMSKVMLGADTPVPTAQRVQQLVDALNTNEVELAELDVDLDGRCRVCQQTVTGATSTKREHVRNCTKKRLTKIYMRASLEEVGSECPFQGCALQLDGPTQAAVLGHFLNHLGHQHQCTVIGCTAQFADRATLVSHLETVHSVLATRGVDNNATSQFCTPCNAWFVGAQRQIDHAAGHLANLKQRGSLTTAFRSDSAADPTSITSSKQGYLCPACVFDETFPVRKRWKLFATPQQVHFHFNSFHILRETPPFACTFPDCDYSVGTSSEDCSAYFSIADHMIKVHHVRLAGVAPGTQVTRTMEGDPTRFGLFSTDATARERVNQLQQGRLGPLGAITQQKGNKKGKGKERQEEITPSAEVVGSTAGSAQEAGEGGSS